MNNPTPEDDAQRELEQRALRNVRGLVDKMDNIEQVDHKRQKRLLLTIVAIAVVMGTIVVVSVSYISGKQQGKPVVIDPKKLPPIQGGPPR
jgi:hypothetical protein